MNQVAVVGIRILVQKRRRFHKRQRFQLNDKELGLLYAVNCICVPHRRQRILDSHSFYESRFSPKNLDLGYFIFDLDMMVIFDILEERSRTLT